MRKYEGTLPETKTNATLRTKACYHQRGMEISIFLTCPSYILLCSTPPPPLLPRLTQNNANTRNRIMLQQIFPRKYPSVGNQCKSIYMYIYLEIKKPSQVTYMYLLDLYFNAFRDNEINLPRVSSEWVFKKIIIFHYSFLCYSIKFKVLQF